MTDEIPKCNHCGGDGFLWASKEPGGPKTETVDCNRCDGTGLG